MTLDITITTQIQTGSGFAVSAVGEEVFVPAHIMKCYDLKIGGRYMAHVQKNEHHNTRTPWRVYGIDTTTIPEVKTKPVEEDLESLIMEQFSEGEIYTSAEMIEALYGKLLSTDPRYTAVANKLHNMHKAGQIAAAAVRASASQERASFFLFAKSAQDFA